MTINPKLVTPDTSGLFRTRKTDGNTPDGHKGDPGLPGLKSGIDRSNKVIVCDPSQFTFGG